MELCVLQNSSISSVEKLDEIASRFPNLAYMLNQIAIEIIELQEAADKHKAEYEAIFAKCAAEIKEFCDEAELRVTDIQAELCDVTRENETLEARLEAVEKTDVEALLEENQKILHELDIYKSRYNHMGKADFIEQNNKLMSWANFLCKRMKFCASEIKKFTNSYRGKFKDNIIILTREMHDDWEKASRDLSDIAKM